MFIPRTTSTDRVLGIFVLMLLCLSSTNVSVVESRVLRCGDLQARELVKIVEYSKFWRSPPTTTTITANSNYRDEDGDDEDFMASIKRQIPSSPDPLHNR